MAARSEENHKPAAYASSFEHLADEMKRLDLLIHLQVLKQREGRQASAPDQFKGLVLWDEEIDEMMVESLTAATGESEAEPRLRPLLDQLAELDARILDRKAESIARQTGLSLVRLSELFDLTAFEELCLMICLAPEIDRKYEKLYAYLQDDVTRKRASVDLALGLAGLGAEERLRARSAFDAGSAMLKHRLIKVIDDQLDAPSPLIARYVKLDDRIVSFLLGTKSGDERLEEVVRLIEPGGETDETMIDPEMKRKLCDFAASRSGEAIFHLRGPYGSGREAMALAVAQHFGLPLILADAERMFDAPQPFEETARLVGREALLAGAAIAVKGFDSLLADEGRKARSSSLLETVQSSTRLAFLLGERRWMRQGLLSGRAFIAEKLPAPDERARRRLWKVNLERHGHPGGEAETGAVAARFRFTPGQIRDAAREASSLAGWRSHASGEVRAVDLQAACRAQVVTNLGALALKIEPHFKWEDIVLPPDQIGQLREICDQVKTRHVVFEQWGFDRKLSLGKGLNALFSGPPGTGKTMAAEVIAGELDLDLYRIDLSQVVSKYIGETEKNLSRVFNEAQSSSAILFFDEADALFGKRSEVKDSHDRYANIEIGYLLQEMEQYDGIAILATNLRQNMDEAFVRRLQSIIEFPFPDEEHRRRIWQVMFPSEAPMGEDVDFTTLAREIRLAGGNIKNIALTAAFYAASDGGAIRMEHLIEATRREYQKLGWPWNASEWDRHLARGR
jgi:SpoVK/Ycf46/Vps4 family AAA+-type ATPase